VELWNAALQGAAKNGHVNIVLSLLEDDRLREHLNAGEALKVALAANQSNVVGVLLADVTIAPSVKYQILVAGIEKMDVNVVKQVLADKRVDPSGGNGENALIRAAAKSGSKDLIELLLSDARVDPSVNNSEALKTAAVAGNQSVVVVFLEDDRVDPTVILERYKTEAIIEALRKRFSKKKQRVNSHLPPKGAL
jgi:DNA-binding protein YbaB